MTVPEDVREQYIGVAQSAVTTWNYTPASTNIAYEEMLPYFRGDKSFEECRAQLESKLTIYIGE